MNFIKTKINKPLLHISSGRFISKEPWIHVKRNIDSFVIILGLEGTVYIQQENEQYEVKPGSVLILVPNSTHFGYKKSEESVSYYWCHFYCEDSYQITNEQNYINEISLLKNKLYQYNDSEYILIPIFSSNKNIDRINILFHQLLHTANSNYYTHYGTNYLLTSLMIELTEQTICKYFEKLKYGNSSKFIEVLEWIRINIRRNVSVYDIAKQFNYNPDYLTQIFKQKTGISLLRYIHNLKLSKAKEMLLRSDISIKEIAYELGFHDDKYFMKFFKKYENLTPTQFRNAYYYTHMNDH